MSTVLVSGFSLNTQIVITAFVCTLTVFIIIKTRHKLNRLSISIIIAFIALSGTNVYSCYSFFQPINDYQISQLSEKLEKSMNHPNGLKFRRVIADYTKRNGMLHAKQDAYMMSEVVLKAYITKKEWKELFDLSEKLGI